MERGQTPKLPKIKVRITWKTIVIFDIYDHWANCLGLLPYFKHTNHIEVIRVAMYVFPLLDVLSHIYIYPGEKSFLSENLSKYGIYLYMFTYFTPTVVLRHIFM